MSIGAANLFTRNIFREFFKPDASPRLETQVSRWASLVVKLGALYFAVEVAHVLDQPAAAGRDLDSCRRSRCLVSGSVHPLVPPLGTAARLAGRDDRAATLAAYNTSTATTSHWASSSDNPLRLPRSTSASGASFILNLAIAVIVTLVLRVQGAGRGRREPCRTSSPRIPTRRRRGGSGHDHTDRVIGAVLGDTVAGSGAVGRYSLPVAHPSQRRGTGNGYHFRAQRHRQRVRILGATVLGRARVLAGNVGGCEYPGTGATTPSQSPSGMA